MRLHRKVSLPLAFSLAACFAAGCGDSGGKGGTTASIAGDDPAGAASDERAPATNHPVVVIATSLGQITLELDRDRAPLTVDNFLRYVDDKRYDGTIVHQVDRGFMVLAGGFDGQLHPIPTEFPIRNEAAVGLQNTRGTVAMARPADAIDSATSQFFFNLADNSALDYRPGGLEHYGYCAFGRVTAGLDVLDRIGEVPVADAVDMPNMPRQPIVIESVERLR